MSSVAVAGYEVRRLFRDRAVPALLLLLLALSTYAAWNGTDWLRQRETAIDLLRTEEQETATRMRAFVGSMPAVLPPSQPVLPPGSMAPLSTGQADAYPFTADVAALGDVTLLFKRVWADIGSPTARAAGRFDLAFVIVFLLPLVILAVSYDVWSRERERGVAAMVLSQPVAPGSLIAVKVLAQGVVVLVASMAVILPATAWAGAREVVGLAALALTILAYGSFWLAVVALVALLARRSTEAAVAVGSIWLLVVVMAPSLTLTTVDLVARPPSEMRFATEMKARLAQITERQRLYREASPPPARTPSPRGPDQMRAFYAQAVATDLELAPTIAAHRQAWDARRRLLDHVRLFLPSVAVQDALDRIAGSDADRALAFQDQVVAFRQEQRLLYKGYLDRGSAQTVSEYDNLPRFRFHETGGTFQARVLTDLAALIVATLLILIIAWAMRGRAATP